MSPLRAEELVHVRKLRSLALCKLNRQYSVVVQSRGILVRHCRAGLRCLLAVAAIVAMIPTATLAASVTALRMALRLYVGLSGPPRRSCRRARDDRGPGMSDTLCTAGNGSQVWSTTGSGCTRSFRTGRLRKSVGEIFLATDNAASGIGTMVMGKTVASPSHAAERMPLGLCACTRWKTRW